MSGSLTGPRHDPELTELLRAGLGAPPLRPGFHEELEVRLQAEDAARRDASPLPAVEPRRRRFAGRRSILIAAVAAAAAIIAFAVLPAPRGTATATAADMLASMNAASGSVQTIRLDIIGEVPAFAMGKDSAGGTVASRFKTTAELTMSTAGDQRVTETLRQSWKTGAQGRKTIATRIVSSYDPLRHEMRNESSVVGRTPDRFVIRRPTWATDLPVMAMSNVGYQTLAASLRAQLAADPKMPVLETTYLGRPAYRARLLERWPATWARKFEVLIHWDVTVDKATGLLMAATYRMEAKGQTAQYRFIMRVTRLETDPQLPAGWQLAPRPARGRIMVVDEGTRFGTSEQVAARSWPTLPLIPQWAPAGYRLTDVASAGFPGVGSSAFPWRPSGRNRTVGRSGRSIFQRASWALPGQTVLVRFRRGFSTFVVEITPKTLGEQLGDISPAGRPGAEDTIIGGGYLKGASARTWITPYEGEGPTLITFSDRSQIAIRGDLTRQELIDVADSMKAYGDLDKGIMPGYGD
jgi:hypothetical protein